MRKLGRIWKFYFIYTFLLVMGVSLAGFALEAQVKRSVLQHLEKEALTLAKVMAQSLPESSDLSLLDQFCDSFRHIAGVRITLLDGEGNVIGESESDIAGTETKMDRPEVQEALRKGEGNSIRFSKTLRIDMLYTAIFVKEKGKILRLAVPMTKIGTFQNEVMILMSLALFLAPVFAILVTFFFIKYRIYEEDNSTKGKEEKYSRPTGRGMAES
jgi:two-component system, OmpR family, phosphate regulon sensor histidine kinase PhoR